MNLAVVGYVIVSQLVAQHPLHGMLTAYDREIAALRSTQSVAGLRDPSAATNNAAAAMRGDASVTAAHVDAIGSRDAAADRGRERAAADALLRSERAPERSFATYTSQLATETEANQRAYGGALAQRTERAYAARAQQMREKESTLAFDVERRDAGRRLMLQLKLAELHLTAARRAQLRAQMDALNASERRTVDALRRRDAAELAAYRGQLESAASAGAGAMDAQLRAKAGANYAILRQVFNEGASTAAAFPTRSQLVAFTNGYAARRSAQGISADVRAATADVTQRFSQLGAVDAASQRDVAAQLRALQIDRATVYRAILAQIASTAQMVGRRHHVAPVKLVKSPQRGGVNLTGAVASELGVRG